MLRRLVPVAAAAGLVLAPAAPALAAPVHAPAPWISDTVAASSWTATADGHDVYASLMVHSDTTHPQWTGELYVSLGQYGCEGNCGLQGVVRVPVAPSDLAVDPSTQSVGLLPVSAVVDDGISETPVVVSVSVAGQGPVSASVQRASGIGGDPSIRSVTTTLSRAATFSVTVRTADGAPQLSEADPAASSSATHAWFSKDPGDLSGGGSGDGSGN